MTEMFSRVSLICLVALGGIASTALSPAFAEADDKSSSDSQSGVTDYKDFVQKVGNEIVKILADRNTTLDERRDRFRTVLENNFDIKSIGKFVLGRYWRTISEEQKSQFLKLFEDALVENYSSQFDNYNNESLEVKGSRDSKAGGMIVQSQVIRPQGGNPLNVDWKVFSMKAGSYKILDIVVDGVSLSNTQRSTYAATIQNNNGSIDALLKSMQDKNFIKNMKAASSKNS